jgi:hypothetical protein
METAEILKLHEDFLKTYNVDDETEIWNAKSREFRDFWDNKIMKDDVTSISEAEIDTIVRILDRSGKGNTKKDTAVARVMVPQGVWRRMFTEIKNTQKLRELLNGILSEINEEKIAQLIDSLYKFNEGKKNGLTGKSGNAINAMMFAYTPSKYVSVVSLNDRQKIIEQFGFKNGPDFEHDLSGERIVKSNNAIIEGFKGLGINTTPRAISNFLYFYLKPYWKPDGESEEISDRRDMASEAAAIQETSGDQTLFYMEKQLEDFLIANWDRTEFAKKYELINDKDGELVSQQYPTGVGPIDILVKDRESGQYVVIELKRNQTSDDTVGQIARYMGWIKENEGKGAPVKGIIIAASPDKRLTYALKIIDGVELYLYKVNFTVDKA